MTVLSGYGTGWRFPLNHLEVCGESCVRIRGREDRLGGDDWEEAGEEEERVDAHGELITTNREKQDGKRLYWQRYFSNSLTNLTTRAGKQMLDVAQRGERKMHSIGLPWYRHSPLVVSKLGVYVILLFVVRCKIKVVECCQVRRRASIFQTVGQ